MVQLYFLYFVYSNVLFQEKSRCTERKKRQEEQAVKFLTIGDTDFGLIS